MRWAAVGIAVVASATAFAGCGLTADYSGLQGGARDGGVADAPSDVSTSGDGRGDAADLTDAADGHANAGDSGTDGATADAGFCASLATPVHLCADFDEGQPVSAGWSAVDVSTGQSVLVDLTYYSPPGSFYSAIAPPNAPQSARLQEDMPTSATHVHVEFEMLLPQGLNGNYEIATLHQPVASGVTYGVFYKYEAGNLLVFMRTLGDDGGEIDVVNMIGPPTGAWMHVEIDIAVGVSGSITVKHDGAVVASDPLVDTSTTTRASMFVELGYYSDVADTAEAHFDNVIVDWQ